MVMVMVGVDVGVMVMVVVGVEVGVMVGVEVEVEVGVVVVVGVALKEEKMKVLVENIEKEGMEGLMGKVVTLFCINYIYTGTLIGINTDCVKLKDPKIVYETGAFSEKDWKDAQSLPHEYFYISRQAIESFGEMK